VHHLLQPQLRGDPLLAETPQVRILSGAPTPPCFRGVATVGDRDILPSSVPNFLKETEPSVMRGPRKAAFVVSGVASAAQYRRDLS
jgi:hypothetical protein